MISSAQSPRPISRLDPVLQRRLDLELSRLRETPHHALGLPRSLATSWLALAESGDLSAILSKEHQRELFLDYGEAQKWLGMLPVYHPARESERYYDLCQAVTSFRLDNYRI